MAEGLGRYGCIVPETVALTGMAPDFAPDRHVAPDYCPQARELRFDTLDDLTRREPLETVPTGDLPETLAGASAYHLAEFLLKRSTTT